LILDEEGGVVAALLVGFLTTFVPSWFEQRGRGAPRVGVGRRG
jgi:hypothetical protein